MMAPVELGALYYPYHPKDGEWLRHALLYYDYVATTVPSVLAEEPDPIEECAVPEHLKVCRDNGLYRPAVDALPDGHVGLARRLATINPAFEFAAVPGAEDFGLSQFMNPRFMARDQARGETFLLADFLARETVALSKDQLVPATDLDSSFRHLYGPQPMGQGAYAGVYITLTNVFPAPASDVELKNVVAFRVRRKDELQRLRKAVGEIREAVGRATSAEELTEALHFAHAEVAASVGDLRSALGSDLRTAISTTIKELLATQPAAAAGIAAVVGGAAAQVAAAPIQYVVGGAAVAALGGLQAAYVRTRASRSQILLQSPYAYLYLAQRAGIIDAEPG